MNPALQMPGGPSAYAPWEAERTLAPILAQAGPNDLLILAGEELSPWLTAGQAPGGPKLLAYLAAEDPKDEKESLAAHFPGISLAAGQVELMEAMGRELVYGNAGRVRLLVTPGFAKANPLEAERVQKAVEQGLTRCRLDRATRKELLLDWLAHLSGNIKCLLQYPDISCLAGVLKGVPAIVAGAGPSLDQSLPALAKAAGKAAVFAAASALKPLSRAGLPAHFAFALEAKDESRQFQGLDTGRTILAAASTGNPRHFSCWQGPKSLFHLLPMAAGLGGGSLLPTGGHAGSAAFSLAFLMGCDPIILVGQDLAFSNGRVHAAGRPGGEEEGPDAPLQVEALDGGTTYTSPSMLSYLAWYQEAAAFLGRKHPERLVVNASAAGARLAGFPHAPLSWLIKDLQPINLDLSSLVEALPRLPKPEPAQVAARLSLERAQARKALATLRAAGLDKACQSADPGSAAAALLELYLSGEQEQAAADLTALMDLLRSMEEGLYA